MKPGVALPADNLVTVILLGKKTQRWFNNSSAKTKYLKLKMYAIDR